jgi:hypothetical protein
MCPRLVGNSSRDYWSRSTSECDLASVLSVAKHGRQARQASLACSHSHNNPRVKECPAQLVSVRRIHMLDGDARLRKLRGGAAVEVEVLRVHLRKDLILNHSYVDPSKWQPLIRNFRALLQPSLNAADDSKETIMVTSCIRYTIDPHMHGDFEQYARNWPEPIKRCG